MLASYFLICSVWAQHDRQTEDFNIFILLQLLKEIIKKKIAIYNKSLVDFQISLK